MYNSFVLEDSLISPDTGYSCKRITKQNIRQFGFKSVEELHNKYPEFPLICKETKDKKILGSKSIKIIEAGNIIRSRNIYRKELEKIEYYKFPSLCPKCDKPKSYEKRKNLFCSQRCSNSREHNESTRQKISRSIKKSDAHKNASFSRTKRRIKVNCCICSKSVSVIEKETLGNVLCKSKTCRKEWSSICGKKSAYMRSKRSKHEIELYELLQRYFINVSHNEPTANGWDADILLNDHKIAILWNGPWHYKEMGFKNHSLKQVVNRDCIKIEEFEALGWDVLIFQDNEWKPETAFIETIMVARERIELSGTGL